MVETINAISGSLVGKVRGDKYSFWGNTDIYGLCIVVIIILILTIIIIVITIIIIIMIIVIMMMILIRSCLLTGGSGD